MIVTTFHPHHYQSQEDTTRGIGTLRLEEKKNDERTRVARVLLSPLPPKLKDSLR